MNKIELNWMFMFNELAVERSEALFPSLKYLSRGNIVIFLAIISQVTPLDVDLTQPLSVTVVVRS